MYRDQVQKTLNALVKEHIVVSVCEGRSVLLKRNTAALLAAEVGVEPNEGAFVPSIFLGQDEIYINQPGLTEADREAFRFVTSRCLARDVRIMVVNVCTGPTLTSLSTICL
jgi:hypothetical protein